MDEVALDRWVSPEDYLEYEHTSQEKHEYVNGEIYAMAGADYPHIRMAMNLSFLLTGHLRGRPCEASGSDLKVHNKKTNSFFYPDLTVICGEPIFTGKRSDVVTNPLIVIEIFSSSTEGFDRGDKFNHYQILDTLQTYVLVSQTTAKVEVFTRQGEQWEEAIFEGMESVLTLEPIGFSAPLSEIYLQVKFP